MAENSKIGWTTHTFNPWRGCTKVSEGCQHCYAETLAGRNPGVLGVWGPNGTRVVAAEAQWREPVKWNRESANNLPIRSRVFCASLADVFEGPETMPASSLNEVRSLRVPDLGNDQIAFARERLFELMDETPNLDWLLLTKRPQNVTPLYGAWLHWARTQDRRPIEYPANVWCGATAENQQRLTERAPHLIDLRRRGLRVAFLSVEPMLGPVDLRPYLERDTGINWVICGGESGGGARPFNTDWARILRDQCGDAGVPFFMKQLGSAPIQLRVKGKGEELDSLPVDLRVREFPVLAS